MDQKQVIRYMLENREKLLAYVWPIVRDAHVSEDVYQNVAILAMEKCEQIEDEKHLQLWLRKASRYKSLEALRQKDRMPPVLSSQTLDILEPYWDAYDAFETTDLADSLKQCIDRLTTYARQLIKLRYGEGLSCNEVADSVNRNVHAVYKSLSRTHDQLRLCMESKGQVPFRSENPAEGVQAPGKKDPGGSGE